MPRILLIALFIIPLYPVDLPGFVIQTARGPNDQYKQLRWPDLTAQRGIRFIIDSRGSQDIADKEATFRTLRASFSQWASQPMALLRFEDRGTADSPVVSSRDRENVLTFDETGAQVSAPRDAGIVALTRVNSDDRTGEIFDTDIVFNGRDFRFSLTNPQLLRYPFVDLQDVATHEIGHLLGIDHTGLIGPALRRPTMNPFTNFEIQGTTRTLKPDDIAAVGFLYPSLEFSSTGRISGTVTTPDGAGAFGVHVVAYDPTGNFVVSGISGYMTGPEGGGEYAIIGLEPGRYTVGVEPLNGSINSSNFSGIFFRQRFETNFSPEFYDNVPDRIQGEELRVQRGQTLRDINFTTGLFVPGFPVIREVQSPANTPDPEGPYAVSAFVTDNIGLSHVTLLYESGDEIPTSQPMRRDGSGGIYIGEIPGQSRGTSIEYHIEATDSDGNVSTFPTGSAPPLRLKILDLSGKPIAYVAMRESNEVSVLDTGPDPASLVEVARISVGEDPIGLTITPDEKLICVANRISNSVTLIETATNRVFATVPVGRDPVNLASSADAKFLYVNNTDEGTVSVIDLDRGEHVRKISFRGTSRGSSSGPYGIAVSSRRRRIYVTDINENVVVVLDPDVGTEISRIPVVSQPRSLALSPDEKRLYVTGLSEGAGVSVVNTVADTVVATVDLASTARAFGIVVSRDGKTAFVSDFTNNLIIIDTATNRVQSVVPIPGQNTRGIAVTADENSIYVANQDSDNLIVIDVSTHLILRTLSLPEGPRDIAFRNRTILVDFDSSLITAADFDGSGKVGLSDFFLFATVFGTSDGESLFDDRFDLNTDGIIDFSDFFLFAEQFGRTVE